MKNIVIVMLLCLLGLILLPFVGSCQVDTVYQCGSDYRPKCAQCVVIDTCKQEPLLVMQGYGDSRDSPIKVEAGSTIQTSVPLFLVNEPRYAFYRRLHEFANDAEFKGHEKEILDGFGGFLTESDDILKQMSENTGKLELSSERLKIAQKAVDDLNYQIGELARQNAELKAKIETPAKQKKKWAVPVLLGVVAGITIGVLIQ